MLNLPLALNPEPGNRNLERKVRVTPEFPSGVPPPPVPPDSVSGADEVNE